MPLLSDTDHGNSGPRASSTEWQFLLDQHTPEDQLTPAFLEHIASCLCYARQVTLQGRGSCMVSFNQLVHACNDMHSMS